MTHTQKTIRKAKAPSHQSEPGLQIIFERAQHQAGLSIEATRLVNRTAIRCGSPEASLQRSLIIQTVVPPWSATRHLDPVESCSLR